MGSLELIIGPMFAGKSTKLIQIGEEMCDRAIGIAHCVDNRYGEGIHSHDRVNFTGKVVRVPRLSEAHSVIGDRETILIDEAQFFPDLAEWVWKWVEDGKHVVCAGLNGTFERKPFGDVLELIPYADRVEVLMANCIKCGEKAPFSRRIVDSQEERVVGGTEKYAPVCRKHFMGDL